jgi:hypothetical protein
MSNTLRIGFVTEGITDQIMLQEAIGKILDDADFEAVALQPEISATGFQLTGTTGLGWPGVYRWCRESVAQSGGGLRDNPSLTSYDLIVILIDADVAESDYGRGHITDAPANDLPCAQPCPPPNATTDALRGVVLRWMNEQTVPGRFVLCTPSKSLETWLVAGLFPDDTVGRRQNFECRDNPEAILAGKPKARRLVSGNKKNVGVYRNEATRFGENWGMVVGRCLEARRFQEEVNTQMQRNNN